MSLTKQKFLFLSWKTLLFFHSYVRKASWKERWGVAVAEHQEDIFLVVSEIKGRDEEDREEGKGRRSCNGEINSNCSRLVSLRLPFVPFFYPLYRNDFLESIYFCLWILEINYCVHTCGRFLSKQIPVSSTSQIPKNECKKSLGFHVSPAPQLSLWISISPFSLPSFTFGSFPSFAKPMKQRGRGEGERKFPLKIHHANWDFVFDSVVGERERDRDWMCVQI